MLYCVFQNSKSHSLPMRFKWTPNTPNLRSEHNVKQKRRGKLTSVQLLSPSMTS